MIQNPQLSCESQGREGEIIRDYVPKPNVTWRYGTPPNYAVVNNAYFEGRSKIHSPESLEALVQKLVKNWEVESHNIVNIDSWQTMKVESFTAYSNQLKCPISASKLAEIGPYNFLLGESRLYEASKATYETANQIFKECFSQGFAWELFELFSGPPNVSFTWRHFGKHSGPYLRNDGTVSEPSGEIIEVFGHCIARVGSDLKIESLEVFFDPSSFLEQLSNGSKKEQKKEKSI